MALRLNGSTSGYVGIDAPATAASNTLVLPNGNGSNGQALTTNGSGTLSWTSITGSQWTTTGSNIYYTTGKVGIGQSSPAAGLDLVSAGQTTAALNTAGDINLLVSDTGTSAGNGGSIVFGFNSGSGRFAAIKGHVLTGGGNSIGDLAFSTRNATTDSTLTERMRIQSTGTILIGKTSSDYNSAGIELAPADWITVTNDALCLRLNRTGADGEVAQFMNDGTIVGRIEVSGSGTSYNTSSDYRLKENVVLLTGAIDRVNQLQVHRFNFIAEPGKTVDGFIAHEAQAVVPECVTGEKDAVDDNGDPIYQGIDQSKLVPLLTAALQEAIGRIETLEAANASLEARLTALEVTP